uniref:Uncharacterized protein n=1 Tax=Arundo donax TaxID=35708 RepID=A0A0A9GZG2_ARUDO
MLNITSKDVLQRVVNSQRRTASVHLFTAMITLTQYKSASFLRNNFRTIPINTGTSTRVV